MVSVPCCKNTKAKVSKPHTVFNAWCGVVCFSWNMQNRFNMDLCIHISDELFHFSCEQFCFCFFELQTSAVNFSYCCCSKLYEIPRYRGIARISFSLISLVLIRAVCIYAQGTSTFQYTCIDRLTWYFAAAAAAAVIVYVWFYFSLIHDLFVLLTNG